MFVYDCNFFLDFPLVRRWLLRLLSYNQKVFTRNRVTSHVNICRSTTMKALYFFSSISSNFFFHLLLQRENELKEKNIHELSFQAKLRYKCNAYANNTVGTWKSWILSSNSSLVTMFFNCSDAIFTNECNDDSQFLLSIQTLHSQT